MANLAPAGAAGASGFADAEGRKAVVQEETLRRFAATVGVDVLRFFDRRQRDERERLGFAALENGGTVRAWKYAHFALDRAQVLIAAAVHPFLFVENADAEGLLLHVIERLRDGELVGLGKFLQHGRFHFVGERVDRFAPVHFLFVVERGFDAIARDLIGDFEDLRVHRHQRHLALRFSHLGREFLLDADHFPGVAVGEFEGLDELRFRQLQGGAFDHDDVVLGADVNQIEIALGALIVRRVGNELAVDATDADGADRAGERNIGNGERGRGAVDGENIGIVLSIRAQQQGDNLSVVEITRGEERAERAIRHPRGERFLFRGTPFAFEIAAGKSPDRRRFLAIINRERKPILAFLDFGGRDCARHHHGVAAGDDDGAVGEFRDFASLDGDLMGPDLGRDLVLHNYFLELANSRPVTSDCRFQPRKTPELKPQIRG